MPGTIYTADYVANHWPRISIPFPQGNATSSRYITVVMPRFFPPLPSSITWALLWIFAAFFVVAAVVEIYVRIKPIKPVTVIMDIQRASFAFEIESTTDWFCIGIRDSKLYGEVMPEIAEGEISGTQIGTDRFIVIPKGALKGLFNVTFDMYTHDTASPVLFVRKGDLGAVTINGYVKDEKGAKHLFANYGPLTRYPTPENEVEYQLPHFSFEQPSK